MKKQLKIAFLALLVLPLGLVSMEPAMGSSEGKKVFTLNNIANSVVILDENRIAVNNPAKQNQINVDVVDVNQGKLIKTFGGASGAGFLGATSPNILYVAGEKYPLFYDYQKLEKMGHEGQAGNAGHQANITALVVPDAESVATAGADKKIVLLIRRGPAGSTSGEVRSFAVGQTLTSLAALSKNRIIGVGNAGSISDVEGTNVGFYPLSNAKFSQIAMLLAGIHKTQGRWALGQQDGKIVILDSTQGSRQKTFAAHNGNITALKALEDKYLVSASTDGNIKLWKADFNSIISNENNFITTLVARVNQVSPVTALDVKYDKTTGNTQIVATYADKSVWKWNLNIDELVNPQDEPLEAK